MPTTAVLLGLALSATSGLGYSREAVGVSGLLQGDRTRLEVQALSIEKRDGGEGWSVGGSAMVRLAHRRAVSLWAGADGSHQSLDAYSSHALAPRVEVELGRFDTRLGLYWIGADQKIENVVGLRARAGNRMQFVGAVERVEHDSGTGHRILVSVLWRVR